MLVDFYQKLIAGAFKHTLSYCEVKALEHERAQHGFRPLKCILKILIHFHLIPWN